MEEGQQQTLNTLLQRVAALERLLGASSSSSISAESRSVNLAARLKSLQGAIQQREKRLPHLATVVEKGT